MKNIYLIIFVAIILIIIVSVVCYNRGVGTGKKASESTTAYYKKVIDYYSLIPKEIFTISGKITEIKDNVLSVETVIQQPYVLPEEWEKEIIRVRAEKETKIVKLEFPEDPLEEVKETKISLSDLKIGNQINVESQENIRGKKEITAKTIKLNVAE